jgi:hypothetical protein
MKATNLRVELTVDFQEQPTRGLKAGGQWNWHINIAIDEAVRGTPALVQIGGWGFSEEHAVAQMSVCLQEAWKQARGEQAFRGGA